MPDEKCRSEAPECEDADVQGGAAETKTSRGRRSRRGGKGRRMRTAGGVLAHPQWMEVAQAACNGPMQPLCSPFQNPNFLAMLAARLPADRSKPADQATLAADEDGNDKVSTDTTPPGAAKDVEAVGSKTPKSWPLRESSEESHIPYENLLGHWIDSQGNTVHVLSTDAYSIRLMAKLNRPNRGEMHLAIKPAKIGAGWQCGHSVLDPTWSSLSQMHWIANNGTVTVWVRNKAHSEGKKAEEKDEAE
eukprot:TRINITY_DN93468_c0_g1_i1.p1 TRINITY_DN93468_c0_g1~~TRINITY_DN93468_c0_g1_i1.p1  ORF type:complete len:247 (-),score=49.95 TRINITY_DN93468_c0_g1_i1:174-914(-)